LPQNVSGRRVDHERRRPEQVSDGDDGVFWFNDVNGWIGHQGADLGTHTEVFFNSMTNTGTILFTNTFDGRRNAPTRRAFADAWNALVAYAQTGLLRLTGGVEVKTKDVLLQADEVDYHCGTGAGDIEPRGNVHLRVVSQQ